MMKMKSGAFRAAMFALSVTALSACAATSPQPAMPQAMADGKPAAMDMMKDCPCHKAMKEGKGMMCKNMGAKGNMAGMDHAAMNHGATDIYASAMETMHKNMTIVPSGDADVDFVRGMIPHHQGAIDMAKIVMKNGKDPEIRKLAEGIVKAQESEIAFMNDWLKKHGR